MLHKYLRNLGLNLELKEEGRPHEGESNTVDPRAGRLGHPEQKARTFQALKRTRGHPGHGGSSHLVGMWGV